MTVVPTALVQESWTGDEESMIEVHEARAKECFVGALNRVDMDLLVEVRDRWPLHRDRCPEAYDDLVRP